MDHALGVRPLWLESLSFDGLHHLTMRSRDDREAEFERFFIEHYDTIVQSVAFVCGDAERANDATQEAFIKAYARWNRIRSYDNIGGWVRRIAINATRDAHRAETRRSRREERAASPPPPIWESDDDEPHDADDDPTQPAGSPAATPTSTLSTVAPTTAAATTITVATSRPPPSTVTPTTTAATTASPERFDCECGYVLAVRSPDSVELMQIVPGPGYDYHLEDPDNGAMTIQFTGTGEDCELKVPTSGGGDDSN